MLKTINRITKQDVKDFKTCPTLLDYQLHATKSAIYPGKATLLGLTYCALKLNGEAGELAEHVGKAMRDDNMARTTAGYGTGKKSVACFEPLKRERHELITKEIGDVLWYLSAICNELDITLEEAAVKNLEKLESRTTRNKLQGSGDER